jgi:hypothetical protein
MYGSGSARISYDFSTSADEELVASAGWKMPANGKYLKFWLYGDNSGNQFGIKAKKANGEIVDIAVCTLDFTGYKPMAVELTPDISEISGVYIQKTSGLTGTVYIDQMTVSYSSDADLTAPDIEILSVGTANSGGLTELRAKITDNGYMPINKDNLQLSLDGQEISFSYSDITAELTSKFEHPNDGLIHRLTIKAEDASGNISTVSIDLDAATEAGSAFADTSGHWSGKYADFLNAQGVINGTLRDDGRYFYPDTVMTRAEFAVMMTNYLGINADGYKDTPLAYSDADKIPGWARNAVAAMYAMGVIKGKFTGNEVRFEPEAPVTRAEVMTVLGRTLPKGLGTADISFKDSSRIPNYASEYVGVLVKMNIVTGYSDRTVRPTGNVRRGEAAKMLYGLY